MRTTFLILLIATTLLSLPAFAVKQTVQTITVNNHQEQMIVIFPENLQVDQAYPVLFAPGDQTPKDTSFFWVESPEKLGWVIVQTPFMYRGSTADFEQVVKAVDGILAQNGIRPEGRHAIGWSANSGSASARVASLPGVFQSLSLIPGYARGRTVQSLCKQEDLTVTFVTGSRDGGWLRGAEHMRGSLRECGVRVQFELIRGGGHVLREISGTPLFNILEKNRKKASTAH